MTKQQVIAEIMYEVRMQGSAGFEADEQSYEVQKDAFTGHYHMKTYGKDWSIYPNAAECRKGIARAGNVIIQM